MTRKLREMGDQVASRCTVAGAKAGKHTAMYSAPSASGVLYRTHSPGCVTTACPARTSSTGLREDFAGSRQPRAPGVDLPERPRHLLQIRLGA